MKTWHFSFFLLFAFTVCSAQEKWLKAFNTQGYLNDVEYLNEAFGIAVGDRIHITLDSGRTWVTRNPPPSLNFSFYIFEDVSIVSPTNILVTGNTALDGIQVIYRSEDTCKTFQLVHSKTNAGNLLRTSFYNDKIGMAVGSFGSILKTIDGGKTWSAPITTLGGEIYNLLWMDSLNVFITCNGNLLKTTNGGTTWSEVFHRDALLSSIVRISEETLLVGGWDFDSLRTSGTILLLSRDKGATWTKMGNNIPALVTALYDPKSEKILFGTIHGLFRTTLDFTLWEYNHNPLNQILDIHLNSASSRICLVENDYGTNGAGFNLWSNPYASTLFKPFIPILLPDGPYCQSVPLSIFGSHPNSYDYKWFLNDSLVATRPNPTIVFPLPGNYIPLRVVVSNGVTTDTVSKLVEVHPQPIIPNFELASDNDAYCFKAKAKIWVRPTEVNLFSQLRKGDTLLVDYGRHDDVSGGFETPELRQTTTFTVKVRRTTVCGVNYRQKDITLSVLPNYQSLTQVEVRDQPVCKLSDTTYLKVYPTITGSYFQFQRIRDVFVEMASVEGEYTAINDTSYIKLYGFQYLENPIRINVLLPCAGNRTFIIDSVKVPVYGAKINISADPTAYYLDESIKVKIATNLDSFSVGFSGVRKALSGDSIETIRFTAPTTHHVVFYGYTGECMDSSSRIIEMLAPLKPVENVCKKIPLISPSTKPWLYEGIGITSGAQDLIQDMTVLPSGENVYGGIYFNPTPYGATMARYFITCLDDEGQTVWEHRDEYQLGWSFRYSVTTCTQVESDEEGNVYFSGSYSDQDNGLVLFGVPFLTPPRKINGYVISLDRKGAFRWVYFVPSSYSIASNPTHLRYVPEEQKLYLTASLIEEKTHLIVLDKEGKESSSVYLGVLSSSAREYYPSTFHNSNTGIYGQNSYFRVPQFEYLQHGTVMLYGHLPYVLSGFFQDFNGFDFRPWYSFASRVDTSSGCLDFYPLKDSVPNYTAISPLRAVSHSLAGRMVHVERKVQKYWSGLYEPKPFASTPDGQFSPAYLHTISSHDLLGQKEQWQVQTTNLFVRDIKLAADGNTYVLGHFEDYLRLTDGKRNNVGLKTNNLQAALLFCLDAQGALIWTYNFKADSSNYYHPYLLQVDGKRLEVLYLASNYDPSGVNLRKGIIYKEIISSSGTTTGCDQLTALNRPQSHKEKLTTDWVLYPNPNNGTVLNVSKAVSGKIMDMNGQQLLVFQNHSSIDISILSKGLYLVQTSEGEVQNFVVE